jgi:hypothetical protein
MIVQDNGKFIISYKAGALYITLTFARIGMFDDIRAGASSTAI